jgi:Icc-related predicted phosphoesterase
MNILAVADIHGAVSQVRALLAREEQFDLILIAGDLTHCGTAADAEAVVAPLLATGKPLFAVPGNMDTQEAARYLEDAGISLHGRARLAAGFGFMGAGGSGTSPFGTPFELSDGETESLLGTGWTGIAASPRKILLSHAPHGPGPGFSRQAYRLAGDPAFSGNPCPGPGGVRSRS